MAIYVKPLDKMRGGEVSGLSRRAFLASTSVLASMWALPADLLGKALAAPLNPSDAPTTLLQTIKQQVTPVRGQYRLLAAAAGEPYQPRYDLLGKVTDAAARAKSRRSLLYVGHLSDNHVIDAQTPARLEPMAEYSPVALASALHPQDTLTLYVISQTVKAIAAARYSPVTGAPMAAVINTGDTADSHNSTELRWMIDAADGVPVTPNTGAPGVYEGPQAWEVPYAWQPDNPEINIYGQYGFPRVNGMLSKAVSGTVESGALPVPWYVVFGNHDVIFMGTVAPNADLDQLAVGDRKAVAASSSAGNVVDSYSSNPSGFQRLLYSLKTGFGLDSGMRTVTPDSRRAIFDPLGFMRAMFDSKSVPGPVGHGFTQQNLDSGNTWWKADLNPWFRIFGLDTCNYVNGPDGAVPEEQFNWLKKELAQAKQEKKICIVCSHHNSITLQNDSAGVLKPSQKLYHAEEFVAMLQEFPNMIAWINGHTHVNMITAHPKSGGGGFWEITTASCIDYPQQQQLLEVVDNQDGTMSIFATTIDHLAGPKWSEGDLSEAGLASLSRELASNHWYIDPLAHTGSLLDRNTELLVKAPFDLSSITDAQLEAERNAARARLVAYEGKEGQ